MRQLKIKSPDMNEKGLLLLHNQPKHRFHDWVSYLLTRWWRCDILRVASGVDKGKLRERPGLWHEQSRLMWSLPAHRGGRIALLTANILQGTNLAMSLVAMMQDWWNPPWQVHMETTLAKSRMKSISGCSESTRTSWEVTSVLDMSTANRPQIILV